MGESGSFLVTINVSASASNGLYYGFLTVTRLVDGVEEVVPLYLGVGSVFGTPFLADDSDWSVSMLSTGVESHSFVVSNVGGYNLSDCVPSLGGSLDGQGFVSWNSESFDVPVGESFGLVLSYIHPGQGSYGGFLQVVCVAGAEGQFNSLAYGNQPYLSLVSTFHDEGGTSGGGGIGSCDNAELFALEDSRGGSEVVLLVYPGQSRSLGGVLKSLSVEEQEVSVFCEEVSSR